MVVLDGIRAAHGVNGKFQMFKPAVYIVRMVFDAFNMVEKPCAKADASPRGIVRIKTLFEGPARQIGLQLFRVFRCQYLLDEGRMGVAGVGAPRRADEAAVLRAVRAHGAVAVWAMFVLTFGS